MKKKETNPRLIAIVILSFLPFINLALFGLWAIKENYIYAGIFAVASIIWAIFFSAVLISFTIKQEAEKIASEWDKKMTSENK